MSNEEFVRLHIENRIIAGDDPIYVQDELRRIKDDPIAIISIAEALGDGKKDDLIYNAHVALENYLRRALHEE